MNATAVPSPRRSSSAGEKETRSVDESDHESVMTPRTVASEAVLSLHSTSAQLSKVRVSCAHCFNTNTVPQELGYVWKCSTCGKKNRIVEEVIQEKHGPIDQIKSTVKGRP
jgi:hypothetical protein